VPGVNSPRDKGVNPFGPTKLNADVITLLKKDLIYFRQLSRPTRFQGESRGCKPRAFVLRGALPPGGTIVAKRVDT
jgi:hypothetical protein